MLSNCDLCNFAPRSKAAEKMDAHLLDESHVGNELSLTQVTDGRKKEFDNNKNINNLVLFKVVQKNLVMKKKI